MAMQLDIQNLSLVTNEDRLGKLLLAMVNALVARGWTVEGSGDGIAAVQNRTQTAGPYNVFTSGLGYYTGAGLWAAALGGANKISNTRAWIIVKEPAPSTRAFCFQRSNVASTGYEAYLVASLAYGGFATSGATFNAPPAAVGTSQVLFGTAHNGNGADYIIYTAGTAIAGSNTLIANMMISDTAKGGNSWPWMLVLYNSTLATRVAGMMYESLVETVAGDADPVVSCVGLFANVFGAPNVAPGMTYMARRDDGTAITNLVLISYTATVFGGMPATTPSVNSDGKLRSLPIFMQAGTGGHYKGRMEHASYNMQARTYPSTLDLATATPRIYLGCMLYPWKTAITPGT